MILPKQAKVATSSTFVGGNGQLQKCFVYGTLMAPEVLEELIGRVPSMQTPAFLSNKYRRHPVKDFVFPGVIPSINNNKTDMTTVQEFHMSNDTVRGVLLVDLSPSDLKVFDWFEDDDYTRTLVPVYVPKKSQTEGAEESNASSLHTSSDVHIATDDFQKISKKYATTGTEEWETIEAHTYIWSNPITQLHLEKPWDYTEFRKNHLGWYLENTVKPCRQYLNKLGFE